MREVFERGEALMGRERRILRTKRLRRPLRTG